jgi:hypothetical protein
MSYEPSFTATNKPGIKHTNTKSSGVLGDSDSLLAQL